MGQCNHQLCFEVKQDLRKRIKELEAELEGQKGLYRGVKRVLRALVENDRASLSQINEEYQADVDALVVVRKERDGLEAENANLTLRLSGAVDEAVEWEKVANERNQSITRLTVEMNRLDRENAALWEAARWRKWPEEKPEIKPPEPNVGYEAAGPTNNGPFLVRGAYGELTVDAVFSSNKGWVEWDGDYNRYFTLQFEPTHWRPIDQPKEEGK